ncbi:MAG: response regulator [Paludibacteraceae bacterium]|nr:response regulator [Paludibacteraceae bacterium]
MNFNISKYINLRSFYTIRSFLSMMLMVWGTNMAAETPAAYTFSAITNNSGLSHNTVYDICQDDKGFMWFATDGGLNRYDGQNIKHYYPDASEHSLPAKSVQCLIYSSHNQLFAGTSDGLALYRPETDDFERILYNNKSIGEIISLGQGPGSEIVIASANRGAFVYNYEKKYFRALDFLPERVYGVSIDKNGDYWAFSRFRIYRFDKNFKIISEYAVSPQLFNSAISYLGTDSKGILWLGTFEKGLYTFDFERGLFLPFLSSNGVEMYYVRTVEEGQHKDEYWVGTEKGLYILNVKTGYFQHYVQSFDQSRKTINDNAIYKVYRNTQNVFFVGTYFGGVNVAKTRHIGFEAIYPDDKSGFLQGKALSAMLKAPDGNLWIATEDAGIAILNPESGVFRHLTSVESNPKTISTNNVHALLIDDQICWAGHFMGGISKIDIKTGQAKRYMHENGNPFSLNNNFVFSLHFLSPDSLLVGTIAGVELFDKKTEKFIRFRENELNDSFVYSFFTAPDGKVWICTYNNGIFVLDKNRRGLMTHYRAGDESGLPGNSIISHLVDSKKQIWIGTRGDGLLRFDNNTQKFITCSNDRMLVNDVVYGILEDNKSMLWISSNKGISRLSFADSTATHFNFRHGIAGNQFNYKSYFKDNNGTMYFGSVNGLTCFKPEHIVTPRESPVVYFSNFKVFNEIIVPNTGNVLDNQIDFSKNIHLSYNQNSFTLEFASVNYLEGDIAFEYYLEGFDTDWSPLSEKLEANYTNISPGRYVFHIRAKNRISDISGPERNIEIVIASPLWATWYAYLLYSIIILSIVYSLYRNHQNRQKEKMALAIEKIEKQNLNVLHQHKMNFFTYISHEFKTPLSIIIASVEMLFQRSENETSDMSEIHQSIKRSATRLLFLVNQLMEFRKIETDHAVLNITKGNVMDFLNQILAVYRPLLSKKGIELNVQMNYSVTEISFDFDKLEKILTNLLTNAVKYTAQKGSIGFSAQINADMMEFSVKDSGKGLSESQKDKIFEVFYSEDFSNDLVESSGIGLALTAGLVKLLKGQISVQSELNKGTEFVVVLPLEYVDTGLTELKAPDNETVELLQNSESLSHDTEKQTNTVREYSIVIAEDSKDLLMLLHKNFKDKYKVKCVENGKEAWEHINEKMPDLVITDIMMPLMSGTELCQKIKTDVNLCHIPVIMLTAKTTPKDKLEGLQLGADAYVAKPFSMEELEVRINNILNARRVLKNRLKELAHFEGLCIPATNHEQAFVEKVFALIQENIDNNELDVQFLSQNLSISRTNLHNKLKQILDMNTTEFINTIRINKAKDLILKEDLTFSEISYMVGYNDVTYFNRVFRKNTGKTPTEFKNEHRGKAIV